MDSKKKGDPVIGNPEGGCLGGGIKVALVVQCHK